MIDRGIKKWQPFNSCFSSSSILREIKNNKDKISFPKLSDDQLIIIEEIIKEAYILKINVEIKYYLEGKINVAKGIINQINFQEKKIYLNNKILYFKQILDIKY